ncbi:MAG: NAD(P)/FAD-dependent oxidoreductase [Actinomycetota bacterium]|nr:NAD(P)/FAD-dependent oxidoreductase [Actinomycetota bacterium]
MTADVLICGASFAGLAVARELAGCGASVLLIDRYHVGERATSACAAPTQWLHALGVGDAICKEIPHMTFTTPRGSVRYRLPWSWSAFDYRRLCQLLYAQSDANFHTATVRGLVEPDESMDGDCIVVMTDRGALRAPLVVDALGWRRVLGSSGHQPPESPLSRGLEVHPEGGGEDLDVWIERSLVRRGYGWRVPTNGEARVGVASYAPGDHVRKPTVALAERLGLEAVRYQGNWFPHRLRPATENSIFFVGDSAGHCFPLSGEGIRTAFYFGIACGRELTAVLAQRRSRTEAIRRYGAFSASHSRAFTLASNLQRIIPALPPRLLMAGLRLLGHQRLIDRSFGWYLDQAHPSFARPRSTPETSLPALPQ